MADIEKIPMGQEGISKEIVENEKDPLEKLQEKASYFLKKVAQAVETLASTDDYFNDKDVQAIYNATRKTLSLAREITSSQYNFEGALNEFLGRKIALLWISQAGKIYYAAQVDAKDIYAQGSRKSEGRLSVNISKRKFGELTTGNEKKLIQFDEYLKTFKERATFLKLRKVLYKGVKDLVIERWEWNHNPQNVSWYYREKENGYPYRNTFWWKSNNGEYGHSVKMNRGNIYEAYVSIIFDKEKKLSVLKLSGDEEENVESYWEYMKSRNILNNIPGVVEGDVVFDNIHQYAVKMGTFNTASLGPYIVAALEILKLEECTPDKVKQEVLDSINPNSFQEKIKEEGFKVFVNSVKDTIDKYTTKK